MEKSNKNKRKSKIIIQSFGEPAPDEVIEAAEKLSNLIDKTIPDKNENSPKLPEKMTCFRDSFSFIKAISEAAINGLSDIINEIEAFLKKDPSEIITDEDLIKFIMSATSATSAVADLDTLFSHLSEGFTPILFETTLGTNITFGELLDTDQTKD